MQLFLFNCLLTLMRFIPTLLCLGKSDIPFHPRFLTPLWGWGLRINLLESSVMLILNSDGIGWSGGYPNCLTLMSI